MGTVLDKEGIVTKKDLQSFLSDTEANQLFEQKAPSNDPYLKTSSAKNMFAPSGNYLTETLADNKFETKKDILATKNDIAETKKEILETKKEIADTKAEIIKWMFIFWVGQILALIAIFNFMMK